MIDYKQITLDDRDLFKSYLKPKNIPISYYNFTNIFMWRNYVNFRFAIVDNFLCVTGQYKENKNFSFFPIGNGDIKKPIEKILAHFKNDVVFMPLSNDMAAQLEKEMNGKFSITKNRDQFDYVYNSADLISLSGKKLHSKRNHINKFKSLYNYSYEEIGSQNIDECILAIEKWCKKRECKNDESLSYEKNAIIEVFKSFDKLELKGGIIRVDGEIIAFSVGEKITSDMALIHIEKADVDYSGAYAMINQQFAQNEWSDVLYINREEDMGAEGLRKAKLSYNPAFLNEISRGSIK